MSKFDAYYSDIFEILSKKWGWGGLAPKRKRMKPAHFLSHFLSYFFCKKNTS